MKQTQISSSAVSYQFKKAARGKSASALATKIRPSVQRKNGQEKSSMLKCSRPPPVGSLPPYMKRTVIMPERTKRTISAIPANCLARVWDLSSPRSERFLPVTTAHQMPQTNAAKISERWKTSASRKDV